MLEACHFSITFWWKRFRMHDWFDPKGVLSFSQIHSLIYCSDLLDKKGSMAVTVLVYKHINYICHVIPYFSMFCVSISNAI